LKTGDLSSAFFKAALEVNIFLTLEGRDLRIFDLRLGAMSHENVVYRVLRLEGRDWMTLAVATAGLNHERRTINL